MPEPESSVIGKEMLRPIRALLWSLLLASLVPACGEPGTGPDLPASPAAPAPTGQRAAPQPASAAPVERASADPVEPASSDLAEPDEEEQEDEEEDCTADIDCATTALPAEPVVSQSDCCFPTCEKRAAPRAEVDRLQAAYGATCKEVLCAPQSCAPDEPVPVCRSGHCAEKP
jgi:hypothetical protein